MLVLGISAYQSIVSANLDQASLPERALTTDPLFDRSTFIAKVKGIFKPIERVLPKGDTLDYNRTVLFSGLPNNTNEHIVIVPLSKSSLSKQKARRLGIDLTWQEANPIALAAYYIIAPNDFSSLEAGKPYLTIAISWEKRVV